MAADRHRRDMRSSSATITTIAAQQRHNALMRVYRASQSRAPNNNIASHDLAVLQRNFQFIRDDDADLARGETDWEVRMSVRYYRKLFREYALADLSRYREGKVGLRWRTEMEVVAGKGQFVCGNKACDERVGLRSYELLFAYVEHGEKKRCLVKVRACEACARKLFYRKLKESEEQQKKRRARSKEEDEEDDEEERQGKKRRRKHSHSDSKRKREEDSDSIHTRCAEINATETHGLRPASDKNSDEEREWVDLLL